MAVGVDIGSHSIKAVETVKETGSFRLLSAGIVAQGAVNIASDSEADLVKITTNIKRLFKEAQIGSKQVVVALPESQVFTRLVKFPPLSDTEVASAIRWEAEQYIPIPLIEAQIQHFIVERREISGVGAVEVLLVAAPKKLVEKYVKIITLCGLEPIAVETETLALVRSLAPSDQTAFVIDFGASSTDIAIAKNANLVFSRSIPTAGEALTRAVATNLSVPAIQAEEYKKSYGLSKEQLEGKVRAALDPLFRIVADEMKKAVQFYQADQAGDAPKIVILSGGTSALPDAVSTFSKLLGLDVVIGNPFSSLIKTDAETAKKLAPFGPLYAIAAGLSIWQE